MPTRPTTRPTRPKTPTTASHMLRLLLVPFALVPPALAAPRVVVVGGTHGNEFTGIYVVEQMEARRGEYERAYPSLRMETLVANPKAYAANRRFVDDEASGGDEDGDAV